MMPPGRVLNASDCAAAKLFTCEQPVVSLLADVLRPKECDRLIEIGRERVQRSCVVDPESGDEITIDERRSEGAFVNGSTDALVATIDRRLAELFRLPAENGEDLHILRYGISGEYRPHFDFFPEEQAGSKHHMQRGGQRIATVILYLNEVERGGDTTFPDVGLRFHPRRGGALYFEYVNALGQSDPSTLHAGTPVEEGEKWIATKWIRPVRRRSASRHRARRASYSLCEVRGHREAAIRRAIDIDAIRRHLLLRHAIAVVLDQTRPGAVVALRERVENASALLVLRQFALRLN